MKSSYIIKLSLLVLIMSCGSRTLENSVNILFKRWKIDYIEMNGHRINQFAGEKISNDNESEYEFKKDKTYSVFSSGKIESVGTWEWHNDENCIYLRDEYNEISGKIINIGKNRITLIPTSVVGYYPELEIARFYYIPK